MLHPIPASLMLTMFGLGIGYSSLIGLLLQFLLVLLVLFYQTRIDLQRMIQ